MPAGTLFADEDQYSMMSTCADHAKHLTLQHLQQTQMESANYELSTVITWDISRLTLALTNCFMVTMQVDYAGTYS